MKDAITADKTAKKQHRKIIGRPFEKGVSGNKDGRPKGKKNFKTLFEEAIKEIKKDNSVKSYTEKDILKIYIGEAIKGNGKILNDLINRLYGKPKEMEEINEEDDINGIEIIINKPNKENRFL